MPMIPTMVSYDIPYVLEPDTCLSAQVAALHTSGQLSGELRLLHAILCDALHCLRRNTSPRERRECRAAMEWLQDDDIDHPMSFASICLAFHLNVGAVRSAVARNVFRIGSIKVRVTPVGQLRGSRQRNSRLRDFKLREAVTT